MKNPFLIRASILSTFSLAALIVGCGNFKATHSAPSGLSTSPSATAFTVDSIKNMVFQMGVTHIDGKYRFTDQNFLEEGAQRILDLGTREMFVYLERNFRERYPQHSGTPWGDQEIKSLKDLAQSKPFENIFAMPFNTYLLTAFSFGMGDGPFKEQHPDDYEEKLNREENEFYELTKYLLRAYDGSGKTFVLKNWEGDWWGLRSMDAVNGSITDSDAQDIVRFFSARQRGVLRAREESSATNVWVLHAIEVNRVADLLNKPHLGRITNRVIPYVQPPADMIAYSIYDTLSEAGSVSVIEGRVSRAVEYLLKNTPDPLGLGSKRIILSEVGVAENGYASNAESEKRLNVAIRVGQNMRLHSASFWQIYDNECRYKNSSTPVEGSALALNDPRRPRNVDCYGYYFFRPDGSEPLRNRVLKTLWNQTLNQLPHIPLDFRPIQEPVPIEPPQTVTGVFKWETYVIDKDCSFVEIRVSGEKSPAISAHARENNETWDLIGQIDEATYSDSIVRIPLGNDLREKIMTTGLRFTVADDGQGTWDTTPDLHCRLP